MLILYLFVLQCAGVCSANVSDGNESSTDGYFKDLFVKGEMPLNGVIPLLNRKVFRGTRVTIKEHPYIVSIRRMISHYLTATLLTRNTVITVAHPIYQIPVPELKVIAGENYCDRGTVLLTVLLVIIHEDFHPFNLTADIALIRLYEDAPFKISVKSISLIPEKLSLDGTTAFVTGWGRCDTTGKELCLPRSSKFYNGEIIDPMLRTIKFTIKTQNNSCEMYNSVLIKKGMMCLGELRSENALCPCMAVPGAPLVVQSHLVALQSWGFSCGYYNDIPIVYTSIREYQPWISHNIAVLRVISKNNLTDIFMATRAEVLIQWLLKTRLVVPNVSNSSLEEIHLLDVDLSLSRLNGTVFDVRDFMYSGKYHESKKNMYAKAKLGAISKLKHVEF